MSRKKAKDTLELKDFIKDMSGIYSTTVSADTIDESPQAYKNKDTIIEAIEDDTVYIIGYLKPIYNFKHVEEASPGEKNKQE